MKTRRDFIKQVAGGVVVGTAFAVTGNASGAEHGTKLTRPTLDLDEMQVFRMERHATSGLRRALILESSGLLEKHPNESVQDILKWWSLGQLEPTQPEWDKLAWYVQEHLPDHFDFLVHRTTKVYTRKDGGKTTVTPTYGLSS